MLLSVIPAQAGIQDGVVLDPWISAFAGMTKRKSVRMSDDVPIVDTTGQKCPLPVLKARKAMKGLAAGARLQVLATDPGAVEDFKHFCKTTGAKLIEQRAEPGGVLVFLLEKPA